MRKKNIEDLKIKVEVRHSPAKRELSHFKDKPLARLPKKLNRLLQAEAAVPPIGELQPTDIVIHPIRLDGDRED